MSALPKRACKVLRQLPIRPPRGAAEEIPRHAETLAKVFLDLVLFGAISRDVLSRLESGDLGGRSVFVRGANEERVPPARTLETGKHICRQHRPHEVAEMLDAVDVGQRARDEDRIHPSLVA